MAQLPRHLRNMNLFVDGVGTAGFIESLTTPNLALKMEEHRAGGLDMPAEIDMGMEKLEASFSLSDPAESVVKVFAKPGIQMIARSAFQRDGENAVGAIVTMTGTVKQLEFGEYKSGEKAVHNYTATLLYYKLAIDGADLVEIDVVNMIRKINGTDMLASIRQQIGV